MAGINAFRKNTGIPVLLDINEIYNFD